MSEYFLTGEAPGLHLSVAVVQPVSIQAFTPQPPISMTTIFFLQSVSWLHSDVTPCNSHPPLFGRERNLTFQTQPCPYFCHAVETHTKVCAALRGAEVKAWLSNGGLISHACLGAARLLRAKCQGGKDLLWCWLTSDVAQMQRKALPNYSKEKKNRLYLYFRQNLQQKNV